MRIGIIGAGHIGGTLAGLFVSVGHEVAVSNSRGPETLEGLVTELGDRACAMTAQDAARFGDVVVVVSVSGRYGHFPDLDTDRTTSSELLQAHLPDARVEGLQHHLLEDPA